MSAQRVFVILLVIGLFIVSPLLGVVVGLLLVLYLRRGGPTVRARTLVRSVGAALFIWAAMLGSVLLLLWGDPEAHAPGGAIAGAGTFFAMVLPLVLVGGAAAGLLRARPPAGAGE